MVSLSDHNITDMLLDWGKGDKTALDRVMPLIYQELRRMAHRQMRRERAGNTMQTTVLINEAYLRLIDYQRVQPRDRSHFFAIAAQAMRRILIERARESQFGETRQWWTKVSLDEVADLVDERAANLVRSMRR